MLDTDDCTDACTTTIILPPGKNNRRCTDAGSRWFDKPVQPSLLRLLSRVSAPAELSEMLVKCNGCPASSGL